MCDASGSCSAFIDASSDSTSRIAALSRSIISDVLPHSPLWYAGPTAISNAISFAKFYSRSHDTVIRVYDEAGNVIETHEHAGEFKES